MNQFHNHSQHSQQDSGHGFHGNPHPFHSLQKPFSSAEPEMSLGEFLRLFRLRSRRLWTAVKFQFHHFTLGVFRKRTVRQVTMLGFAGFWLFQAEPGFLKSVGEPIVGLFRSDETRIYDDYPTASLEPGEPVGKKQSPKNPKAKPASNSSSLWNAFTGDDGGNAYAPVSAKNLREQQALDYIEKYERIARAEMDKFGIPASIALAQGLVESRAGTSRLARGNNNHFGMKCFSRKCPSGHCTNATDDHHKDFFRKYKSAWESWRAHSQLLAGGHYSRLKKYGRDYRQWAYGLKSLGYATDRTYAEKLIGMIEKYDLHKFDR